MGKSAYLVVISDILMFYGLYVSHMSRFYGNWLRVGGEISFSNFEIFEISLLSKFFILRTKSVRHYKFQ